MLTSGSVPINSNGGFGVALSLGAGAFGTVRDFLRNTYLFIWRHVSTAVLSSLFDRQLARHIFEAAVPNYPSYRPADSLVVLILRI